MTITNKDLIDEMLSIVDQSVNAVEKFKTLSIEELNYRTTDNSWSILECIEHLNLYADFYIPEIQQQLQRNIKTKNGSFKSGWLGNYFSNMMKGSSGKITKMKSPKDKNPIHSQLTFATLDKFLVQQAQLKDLLELAVDIDLVKTKIAISLTKLIKLRLGDSFRFLIYHVERHIHQAVRLMK